MSYSYPATLGVVLAGGQARRMGGADKALIRIGGATILERVIACLAPQCRRLIVNANDDTTRLAASGLAVVADTVPNRPGPLAGILAGLDFAAEHMAEVAWMMSAPADCPFLPRDLVERLHRARSEAGALLACAQSGERRHPVVALWPVSLRADLRSALEREGVRKVEQWMAAYSVAIADWPTVPVDPFFNVNTPADAAEAERIAARYPKI